jgi:hypothetical protein
MCHARSDDKTKALYSVWTEIVQGVNPKSSENQRFLPMPLIYEYTIIYK